MKLAFSEKTLRIYFEERLDYDHALDADGKIDAFLKELDQKGEVVEKTVVDAEKLQYISSAGLRIFLKLRKYLDFHILHVSDLIYDTISITGMEDILGIERETEEVKSGSAQDESVERKRAGRRSEEVPEDFVPVTLQFEKQAREHPAHLAVVSVRDSFTYKKLNESANRVANYLLDQGAGAGDIVCLMLQRSIDVYAVTLGVLKAGCAYIFVNPLYPDERIAYIYRDSGAAFIISSREMVYERLELFVDELQKRPLFYEDMLSHPKKENPDTVILPEDLCYIIYTSGSTGKPKGVMIEHGNLSNFLLDVPENREFRGIKDRSERFLAMAEMTFDVSVMEEYIPLVTGHTVVFALYEEISNPAGMIYLMNEFEVDGAVFIPSYLSGLLKLPAAKKAIKRFRVMDFGAEAFPGNLYRMIREINPEVYLMNGYGPTEATISCTMKVLEGPENVTIGVPNANVEVLIIDEKGRELPQGETGELLILGKGVGRGYINLPEKTKEVFLDYGGKRAYRSGDLARITENGEIEYLGRKDSQVKIRGLRIELGEVEAVFGEMEGIDNCAAASIEGKYLCLYYVSHSGITEEKLKKYGKEHLAHYMLPDLYMELREMPMTVNRKADRKALPKPELKKEAACPPETEMQKKLLELLTQVMDAGSYGVDTNLPDNGMSSLDVMLFLFLMGEEYKIGINVNDFITHPTIRELERFIQNTPRIREIKNLDRYHATEMQIVNYLEAIAGENNLDLPVLYELDPSADSLRLQSAIYQVLEAHPGFTVRLEQDDEGTLWQIPQMDYRDYEVKITQMEDEEFDRQRSQLIESIPADGKWLFRFEILETPTRKFLYTNANHLVSDAESLNIIIEDMIACYEGKSLAKESFPMTEYAEFLHGFWDTKAGKRCLELYTECLKQAGGMSSFCGDRSDPEWKQMHFESKLSYDVEKLTAFCSENHFSPSTVFSGALGMVLAESEGRESSVYATVFSGRNDSRLSNTVGFISTIFLAFCHPGKYSTVKEYLKRFDRQMLNLMMYPVMPLARVMSEYPNMLDFIYAYQPYTKESYEMDGLGIKVFYLQEELSYEKMNLIFQVFQQKDGGHFVAIDYHGNVYSEEKIRVLEEKFECAVRGLLQFQETGRVMEEVKKLS